MQNLVGTGGRNPTSGQRFLGPVQARSEDRKGIGADRAAGTETWGKNEEPSGPQVG